MLKLFRSRYLFTTAALALGIQPSVAETIGFLYALDSDLKALKGPEFSEAASMKAAETSIQGIQIGPHKVWAAKMGVGNIETAMNTTRLLAKFPCDLIISTGPAGALSDDLQPGAWVRVSEVVGYQRGTFTDKGWILASTSILKMEIPSHIEVAFPAVLKALPHGKLASGDAFIAQDAERRRVQEISSAQVVDMNSFGLALACQQAKTSLLILKVVSDRADKNAGDDFKAFAKSYEGTGGQLARTLILQLPPSPSSPDTYENIRSLLR
ncbi:MAG: hypothetical protein ACOYM3_11605 [Terrimicrobiaceae bacterium]